MTKILFRTSFIISLNFIVIFQSKNINAQQLVADINRINILKDISENTVFFLISASIAAVTLWFLFIFKPFIEVYLLYYYRYGFYFLVNFISLSSVYITFRIYGYSRLYLLLYLFVSSLLMNLSDKIK